MNSAVVQSAIGFLDKLLSQAKRALWDIENQKFGNFGLRGPTGGYAFPEAAMEAFLEELHDVLLVILEAAEMAETRASLVNAWQGFDAKGLTNVKKDVDLETCESPALTFLDHLIEGLRISVSDTMSSEEAWTLNRLEAMLGDTAGLVHRRPEAPANEIDLQRIMHDYLSASFPDFRRNPPIGGSLKTFVPDCGVASVGAAIEFKFVRGPNEVAVAFEGISADSAGYKGSKDWTRFYSVIYQAQPFMLASHLKSDLKRIGATAWSSIVVNGPTKEAKKASRSRRNRV